MDFDILPSVVTPEESGQCVWPCRTSVHCWNCVHPFDTTPVPMAIGMEKTGRYRVKGVFCSVNCAKRYAVSFESKPFSGSRMSVLSLTSALFRDMAKKVGQDIPWNTIKPSPVVESLRCFGGPLTIDEFRANATSITTYERLLFPVTPVNDRIHEVVFHDPTGAPLSPSRIIEHADGSTSVRNLDNGNGTINFALERKIQTATRRTAEEKTAPQTNKIKVASHSGERPPGTKSILALIK